MSKSTIFLVSSFIGSFIIIAIYSSQKERTRRQSIIEKEFKIYKEKANKSLLNPEQK
jgi:preprotein translocase subunit SecG